MTPAAIIREAAAAGVALVLSPAGTIKATGGDEAVRRWLPSIREHKAGIVKALLEANACTGDLAAIRSWLAFIGETNPATIAEVLDKCRSDDETRAYFTGRAAEVGKGGNAE